MSWQKYLVAFAGGRDSYQAALALQEAGKLACLVTDAYTPDRLYRKLDALPEPVRVPLRNRHASGLPSNVVRSVPSLVAYRLLLHAVRGQYPALRSSDNALGRRAGMRARRLGVPSLVYSYYWEGFLKTTGRRIAPAMVFQVHPVPSQIRRLLKADREATGITGWLDEEEVLPAGVVERFEASLHQADGLVVPSNFVKSGLLAIGVPEDRIAVIPYGCFCAPLSPVDNREPATGPLKLLWVGHAGYRKGPHHLLSALRVLPEGTATLTMVCRAGDRAMLGELPKGVMVTGGVPASQLGEMYRTHDYFVMPSLAEGFGLVYLEAMSAGLPVIATPNTGIADLAAGCSGVTLVPAGDPAALARAIETIAADRSSLPERRHAAWNLASAMTWPRFRAELRSALDRFSNLRS